MTNEVSDKRGPNVNRDYLKKYPEVLIPDPDPRLKDGVCTATSWKGNSNKPYGPGNYNRCMLDNDAHRIHKDSWGTVFVLLPDGRSKNIRQEEVQ